MPGVVGFTRELSEESGVAQGECRKVLDGLSKVLVKHLKEAGSCSIPNLLRVKKVVTKARPAAERKVFGKLIAVGPKPERHRLKSALLKKFKDQVLTP